MGEQSNRLAHFPVSFFTVVMGLAGLSIAWAKAQSVLSLSVDVAVVFALLAVLVYGLVAVMYFLKLVRYRAAVLGELHHPVKLNFFPAISIGLILLATAIEAKAPTVTPVLWLLGTGLHLMLTLYVVSVWMHHEHLKVEHINPAWFIPAVGNVLVPIAGVPLGYIELSWFFFSIGMLFWVILLTIVFYRMLFHHPMDQKLLPTLFILIAPPAVGFLAYTQLVGELDAFARVLYYAGLFLTLLLLTQARRFVRLKFSLSWWAYSFPLAAISIASLHMFELTALEPYRWLGAALLLLLTALVGLLLLRTGNAIARYGICLPE